jgi:glycerol-3-phosphate O-acyltransferase
VYILQDHIRIMPTTLTAAVLLLHRKGISED